MVYTGIADAVYGAADLEEARRMYADWGLARVRSSASAAVFGTGCGNRIVVRPENAAGLPPRLSGGSNFRELVWGVASARDLAKVEAELSRDRKVSVDREGVLHTVDDSGLNIGFRVWQPLDARGARKPAVNAPGARQRVDRVAPVYERARPWRMGHVAFFVPDVKAGERFYVKRLGFWLSDRYAGGAAVFLRHAARSDHHNMFMLKSRTGKTELHHIAFEVSDVHEVFGGGLYFSNRGWPTAVGPGRHPISSAYFWYFRNPLGGMMEYFCDPDFVTERWKPTNYRVNRFSEWHLMGGIPRPVESHERPSLAMAKSMAKA